MQSCTPKDTICGIKKTKLRCNSFVASFFVAKGGKLGIKGRNFASNIQSLERKIEKLHRRTRFGHCTIPFAHKVYRTSGGKRVLCVQIDSTQRFELPTTAVGQKFVQRGVQGAWGKLGGKVHPWWRKHKKKIQREIDSEKSLFFCDFWYCFISIHHFF